MLIIKTKIKSFHERGLRSPLVINYLQCFPLIKSRSLKLGKEPLGLPHNKGKAETMKSDLHWNTSNYS